MTLRFKPNDLANAAQGERPTCSLCKKWGIKCEYAVPALNNVDDYLSIPRIPDTLFGPPPPLPPDFEQDPLGFMQFSGMNFDFPGSRLDGLNSSVVSYPTPISGPEPASADNSVDGQNIIVDVGLPSDDVLMELIDLFFRHLYHMFPCFHKVSFMARLQNQELQTKAPILLYAMCCVTARYHHDPTIRSRQDEWYEQAKFMYELTRRDPHPGLRTIQAVLCLVFHGCTAGDFSASWLYLGKAWRQAVVLGMNRMDSYNTIAMGVHRLDAHVDHEKFFNLDNSTGKTAVEREEYRRTLWLLYTNDRNHSWPTGWPHAIDERQFKVDFPVAESTFQAMDPELENSDTPNAPFTRNLKSLIASSSTANHPLNLFHYVALAHVLLGRVAELIHSLHDSPHTPEFAEECLELDTYIVKFRLSLPRSASSVFEAPVDERGHVIWLNAVLNTMSILLHFRCAKNVPCPHASSRFQLAVAAAKNTAHILKDASRISIDLLLSAHLGSALYIAACVLVIEWRLSGDEALKDDIDLFELVFERMNDVFRFMGLKFKLGLNHDLNRSKENLESLRERGFRGLLADCSKWSSVKEDVNRLGLTVS